MFHLEPRVLFLMAYIESSPFLLMQINRVVLKNKLGNSESYEETLTGNGLSKKVGLYEKATFKSVI